MSEDLLYYVALIFLQGIGPVLARRLVAYMGGAKNVFEADPKLFAKVPGIGDLTVKEINIKEALQKAEKELEFMAKNSVKAIAYPDELYPKSLSKFEDSPVVLFYKGSADFVDFSTSLAVVGTRKATVYGKNVCENLITSLADNGFKPVIISGLAYGIDYCAHKSALKSNLITVSVLGHGLDRVYPAVHKKIASEILDAGGALISEYPSSTEPDRMLFVRRNRIIAALSDAVIVVESALKGGALITAEYAAHYRKKVFAVPGRVGDEHSEGCNWLIKNNKALMIEKAEDLVSQMNWRAKAVQTKIEFPLMNNDEKKIYDLLSKEEKLSSDVISYKLGFSVSKVLGLLIQMELKGIIVSLPGNFYTLNL